MTNTHDGLIQHLITTQRLKTTGAINAFKAIDRCYFILSEDHYECYRDSPLGIGEGQTISQPTTVAIMLEALDVQIGDTVLDIGSGSGWTTTLLGHMVGENGAVLGLERHASLVTLGQKNIQHFPDLPIQIEMARKTIGILGLQYDRILVSAAADNVPEALLDQVKVGGRIVIPVAHDIHIIDRISTEKYEIQYLHGFRFVPLIIADSDTP